MWRDWPPDLHTRRLYGAIAAVIALVAGTVVISWAVFTSNFKDPIFIMMVPIFAKSFFDLPNTYFGVVREMFREAKIKGSRIGSLRIKRDGLMFEQDSGVIWAENGVLRFKGLRCEFALPNDSPAVESAYWAADKPLIIVMQGSVTTELRIGISTPPDFIGIAGEVDILTAWQSVQPGDETTILPPTDFPPESVDTKKNLWLIGTLLSMAIYYSILFAVGLPNKPDSPPWPLTLLVILTLYMWPADRIWRFIRVRQIRWKMGLGDSAGVQTSLLG